MFVFYQYSKSEDKMTNLIKPKTTIPEKESKIRSYIAITAHI